jgi:hypothetical protein
MVLLYFFFCFNHEVRRPTLLCACAFGVSANQGEEMQLKMASRCKIT